MNPHEPGLTKEDENPICHPELVSGSQNEEMLKQVQHDSREGYFQMKITRKEVEHVAKLARLALKEEEIETFTLQLSNILTYVDKLNELDTTDVDPTSHVLRVKNVLRDDEVKKSIDREKVLGNAPDRTEEFFRVPKVIE